MTVALSIAILTTGFLPLALLRSRGDDAARRPMLYSSMTGEALAALGRIHRPRPEPAHDDTAGDPAADPPTDPAADPPTDPAADPPTDPAADPPTDPAADPPTDPAAEIVSLDGYRARRARAAHPAGRTHPRRSWGA